MKTFRSIKWTRLSDHASTRVLPSSVAGLHYVQDRHGVNKYFALVHTASSKTVASWRRGRVKVKDVEFVQLIDAAISAVGVDWTRGENDLGIDAQKGAEIRSVTGSALRFENGDYYAP